jgi:ubiquinone biosynthesis protein
VGGAEVLNAIEVASPEQLEAALIALLAPHATRAERIGTLKAALESPAGKGFRNELGRWVAWLVPVEELVPDTYRDWRPVVRDAFQFVVSRLSSDRLATKIVEQFELAPETPSEQRLLRLITRVPGLQKIGQVLARNRRLLPRFRRALSQLENGISDVDIEEIRAIILEELGPLIETYAVRIDHTIFFEASVSAVVRFTWRDPRTAQRERGVFKVMKPHIPGCFAEDMKILQRLAGFLARKYVKEHSRFAGLSATLTEIRLMLGHEVDFRREQRTLPEAGRVYGSAPGVRVPRLIAPLSTDIITALSHERGVKVTAAFRGHGPARTRLAETLVETLLGIPALSRREEAIFHGDPHAGNLLYDRTQGDLVILDWALTERLSHHERRYVAILVLMTMLRDADGLCAAIEQLRWHPAVEDQADARTVRECVNGFLDELPLWPVPGALDAMSLLGDVAQQGVRFPAPLLMFRKAVFTLDGVAEDVAGAAVSLGSVVGRYALKHWPGAGATVWSLLSAWDLLTLDWSALTFVPRFCVQVVSGHHWRPNPAARSTVALDHRSVSRVPNRLRRLRVPKYRINAEARHLPNSGS